jgi:hypothetical protein
MLLNFLIIVIDRAIEGMAGLCGFAAGTIPRAFAGKQP